MYDNLAVSAIFSLFVVYVDCGFVYFYSFFRVVSYFCKLDFDWTSVTSAKDRQAEGQTLLYKMLHSGASLRHQKPFYFI